MDELRAGLAQYQANLASEASPLAMVRMEASTQIPAHSQELSVILANNEELVQLCHWSEEAHAHDRNQMMEIASQHVNGEGAVALWCEMYQELRKQGDADMHPLLEV